MSLQPTSEPSRSGTLTQEGVDTAEMSLQPTNEPSSADDPYVVKSPRIESQRLRHPCVEPRRPRRMLGRASIRTHHRAFAAIVVAVALVTAFCTSCAVRPTVRVAGGKVPCSANTINLLKKKAPEIHSLKATVDLYLTAEEPAYNERLQVGLAAQRPDRLRLNVYAGFSNLVSIAIDGDSVWAFLPSSSMLLAGSVDEVVKLALLPKATGLLLEGVRGVIFPEPFCLVECKSETMEKGKCRLEEDSGEGKRVGIVESRTGRLLTLDFIDKDGAERATVNYRNYRKSGNIFFPHEITVVLPPDGIRLRLVFNRAVLNRDVDEDVFRLKDIPNSGVKRFGDILEVE